MKHATYHENETLTRQVSRGAIAFHRRGEGPPLVLLHGVGLRADSWAAQIDSLCGRFTIHALDLPGHGDSARLAAESPSLGDYLDALERFLDTTVGEPVCIAGHSMGALLAIELAARRPDAITAVAALNAVYRRTPDARAAVAARVQALRTGAAGVSAGAPLERWFGVAPTGCSSEAAARCAAWLDAVDRAAYADAYAVFAQEDGPSVASLQRLAVPALFLTGERDPNSTPAMSDAMAALAPRGSSLTLPDARHMAMMTHPHAVSTALERFFVATTASSAGGRDDLPTREVS